MEGKTNMEMKNRNIHLLIGPVIFIIISFLLANQFTLRGAETIGTLLWMIYWWITCPVHMTVTAFVPIFVNAFLNIVPMNVIIPQYFCDSGILIFGAGLISAPWHSIGLDRRIALKSLSIIGPSMTAQITVWLLLSVVLSIVLPNVAACALLTPIAVTMLNTVSQEPINKDKAAIPILLCIGWGVGLGGAFSPLGGAMNIAAISFIEEFTHHEFMYIDWVYRMGPFCIITTLVMLAIILLMYREIPPLNGTRDYFKTSYAELGPMKKEEKLCSFLFILALLGAFCRPLYASIFPGMAPAHLLLILGCVNFFVTIDGKGRLLTWDRAQKETMWGMILLFGGGLAIGKMINASGAGASLASFVSSMNLTGGFTTIVAITIFGIFLSETTNSTVSAAVVVPIVLSLVSQNHLNPIPYWFIALMGLNAEFLLPISVRAIPVGYGLDPKIMLIRGIPMVLIRMVLVVIIGYICLNYWPAFSYIPYLAK